MSEVMSLRLPAGTVVRLKQLAWRLSLEKGQEVRWASLVRLAIEKVLRDEADRGARP